MERATIAIRAVLFAASLGAGCMPSRPAVGGRAPPSDRATGPAALVVEPDDGAEALLSVVRDARRSIHLWMYLLTDDDAIQALADAGAEGREVRAILEPHPYQADGANQAARDRLTAAGATVTWASPRFALTHAKAVIADGQRAALMTLNMTRAGLRSNREYAVVDDDPTDAASAEAIFAADEIGAVGPAPAGRIVASPANARATLAGLIAGARRALSIEMEELSDPALTDALAAAAARGVAVTIVLPGEGRSSATDGAARRLAAAGVSVRALAAPDVHAKAIVADSARLYTGSTNLTTASLDNNRELGLVLEDATAATRVETTIAADWARAGEL